MPGRYGRRPLSRRAVSPKGFGDELSDEDTPYDYSSLVVFDGDELPTLVDTGLVYPDGDPIYTQIGAPLGFPIVPRADGFVE